MLDPTADKCQTCGHAACDDIGKTCTGLAELPPNAKNCGSTETEALAMVATALPTEAGQCSDDDKSKMMSVKFSCDGVTCAKKNLFGLDGTSKCIADESKISSGCANCMGQIAQCTLKHCALQCMLDPTADKCQTCGHAACDDIGKTCTGLAELPPNAKNCASETVAGFTALKTAVKADPADTCDQCPPGEYCACTFDGRCPEDSRCEMALIV